MKAGRLSHTNAHDVNQSQWSWGEELNIDSDTRNRVGLLMARRMESRFQVSVNPFPMPTSRFVFVSCLLSNVP